MVNDEFETPQRLFDELNKEFRFDLDVASSNSNHKCHYYFTKEFNSLALNWNELSYENRYNIKITSVFMNPPYSRGQLYKWCQKAYEESQKGVTIVGLLPVNTSTKWFHDWIWDKRRQLLQVGDPISKIVFNETTVGNVEIRFLTKRLKFELNQKPQGTSRSASMIVIWRGIC